MDLLINPVKDFCLRQGTDCTYWIGYSGGLDSHVLLHVLTRLRLTFPLKLKAIYINHGLSPHAEKWAQHCAHVCKNLQVDFAEYSIEVKATTEESLEAIARERRYALFAKLLALNDVLLTAHHQDDQAETLLLQMLRGAGLKGLAAMPQQKPFAQGCHGRPLLQLTRAELMRYAEQNHLHWIDDESNFNLSYTRNFLRHDILPLLKKRWPTVTKTLARVAEHCAEAQQLLDEMASHDLIAAAGTVKGTLSVNKMLQLDDARQRQVLRAWFRKLNVPISSALKLQQIQTDLLHARGDKAPYFQWNGAELRRFRDDIYAGPILAKWDNQQIIEWNVSEPLVLPEMGTLQAIPTPGQGLRADIEQVSVRFRQGGEVIQLPGRKCHHELKKLFQVWNVPPWLRDRVPLIYVEDTLAAVVGLAVSQEFRVKAEEMGIVLRWKGR